MFYIHEYGEWRYINMKSEEKARRYFVEKNPKIFRIWYSAIEAEFIYATTYYEQYHSDVCIDLIKKEFMKLGKSKDSEEYKEIMNLRSSDLTFEDLLIKYYLPLRITTYKHLYIKNMSYLISLKKVRNNSYFHIWRLF